MTEDAGTEPTTGNGEADNSTNTVLDKIRKEWKASGSKDPSAKDRDAALAAFRKARKAADDAEKALATAKEAETAAVGMLAWLFGGRSLSIEGVVHDFGCRGDKIYFRTKKNSDVVVL